MRENSSQSITASKRSWRNWRITRQMSASSRNMELSSKPCKWVSGASCSMRATCWLRANCKMWICACGCCWRMRANIGPANTMEPISDSMMTSTWRSGWSLKAGCGRAHQRAHSDSTAHKA